MQAVLPEIRFYLLTVLRLRICRAFRLVINALRAVGKKIENNRPDSRFSAVCGHALAAVLINPGRAIRFQSSYVDVLGFFNWKR